MLRKIRILLAAIFFTGLTLLFLDYTGFMHTLLGWMSKVQFWPAVLALNGIVIVILLLMTIIFGRIYCSVVCPLGITQDIISWFSAKRKGKKARFSYSKAKDYFRYPILVLFIILFTLVSVPAADLIEPYSAFGRMVSVIIAPVYATLSNLLSSLASHYDTYLIYPTEVLVPSLSVTIAALFTLILTFVLSWKNGRTYCNSICPVGTILGFISRFSLLKVRVDKSKCNNCGICSKKCKASCIGEGKVDYSRCVSCMDCLENCNQKAIYYGLPKNTKKQTGRREAISALSLLALSQVAKAEQVIKTDGGLAEIVTKQAPSTRGTIVPAGSLSVDHFTQHCVACQQCVTACPTKILRPSMKFENFMQPVMSYEKGYCSFDCTKCADVCPTGAIRPITLAEKSSVQIGHAIWRRGRCIVTSGKSCGNCARHCPTGAITMTKTDPADPNSLEVPVINKNRCIGCGACEYVCPANPLSAIYVKGYKVHQTI